jgi:hypothetical protein
LRKIKGDVGGGRAFSYAEIAQLGVQLLQNSGRRQKFAISRRRQISQLMPVN